MQTRLRVRRFDPEAKNPSPHFQEYEMEVPEHFTMWGTLMKVREDIDPSLGLSFSS